MKKINIIVYFVLLTIVISGCNPGQLLDPTASPSSRITETSAITSTITPIATFTPIPTQTFTPTISPTPIGSSLGIIVFQRNEVIDADNKTFNLFKYDLSTNTESRLTNNTDPTINYNYPAISPDGLKMAFVKAVENSKSEIFVMDIDGSNIKKISPAPENNGTTNVEECLRDGYPSWSPDAKKIVFSSNRHNLCQDNYDGEIFVFDLETDEINQLTNLSGISTRPWFSPDGSKIAFMSGKDPIWHIYYMDSDGKNIVKITKGNASNRNPKWSPSGEKIIYHSDDDGNIELYIYDILEKTTERVTMDPPVNATGSFSPDDQWISFHSDTAGNMDIYIQNLITGELIQITTSEEGDFNADWSR